MAAIGELIHKRTLYAPSVRSQRYCDSAGQGFRRLKAADELPTLRAALEAHHNKNSGGVLARQAIAA